MSPDMTIDLADFYGARNGMRQSTPADIDRSFGVFIARKITAPPHGIVRASREVTLQRTLNKYYLVFNRVSEVRGGMRPP